MSSRAEANKNTMFVRYLKTDQVKQIHQMLEQTAGREIPFNLSDETFQIKAPDGDVVFAGIEVSLDNWMCRLHREVFNENA